MSPSRINDSEVRNRALWNLLAAPSVCLPTVLGAAALAMALIFGNPGGMPGTFGIAGVALGIGWAAWQWLTQSRQLKETAREQLQSGAEREHRSYLRRLQRRLRKDKDPRTNEIVKQLKDLRSRLGRVGVIGGGGRSDAATEIRDDARALYRSAIASLERTLQHHHAAAEMTTLELREQLLSARESLIEELRQSVVHLAATLDHLQASALEPGRQSEELSRMRDELRMGLDVARNVEQRMDRLDQDFNVHESPQPRSTR